MKNLCRNVAKFIAMLILSLSFLISFAAKTIDILSFNDFHGQVLESDSKNSSEPGMAKFVTAMQSMEKTHPNFILVAGGDNYQGTVLSNLTYGAPVNDMMKELHVTASAVGNHEFDWGTKYIPGWAKDAHLTYLAANIYNIKKHRQARFAQPYLIVEKDGVKIAFIGLTTQETAYNTTPKYVRDYQFEDDTKVTQYWIDYLKSGKAREGKPDAIVALTHVPSYQDDKTHKISGDELLNLIHKTHGLDAVISGHSHQYINGQVDHVPVIQAMSYGKAIGDLTFTFDDQNHLQKITPRVYRLDHQVQNIAANEWATKDLAKYQVKFAKLMNEVIGTSTHEVSHDIRANGLTELGEWICDQIRKETGTQIAVLNGGGIRENLPQGKITLGEIYKIFPFDNKIITFQLSGKDLKEVLEHGIMNSHIHAGQFAGVSITYDPKKPFGHHILSMKLLNGEKIKPDQYYSVAANDFMYQGGDQYDFSQAKSVKVTSLFLRDAVVQAIKTEHIVNPHNPNIMHSVSEPKYVG